MMSYEQETNGDKEHDGRVTINKKFITNMNTLKQQGMKQNQHTMDTRAVNNRCIVKQ